MQKRNENATAVYSIPHCETRYRRGKQTLMIQTYGSGVELIINLDTEQSRLMIGNRLLDIYKGTDLTKMRWMTAAAERVAQALTRLKSPAGHQTLS